MDSAQILQRVDEANLKTACLCAKGLWHSSMLADPVAKVLDDDDLLVEIMVRLGFPTTLVRAALVCKRWFRHASDNAFLRLFRKLHPPRLLGFYINAIGSDLKPVCFVPMHPQPLELASVFCRARFNLDTHENEHPYFRDCLNGSVSVHCVQYSSIPKSIVYNPLFPERGMTMVPPIPHHRPSSSAIDRCSILLKEEAVGLSSTYAVDLSAMGDTESVVDVYILQDGVWCMRTSAMTGVPCEQLEEPILVDNKIYILTYLSGILVSNLTALSFSTIQLPHGVVWGKHFFTVYPTGLQCGGRTMLSRANDSGVYLIHMNELQLRIWLHMGDGWSLVDTICLRETCACLKMSDCVHKGEHNGFVEIIKVGANAEFLLLKTPRCLFHCDVKRRTMRKVSEVKTEGYYFYDAQPFMMIWPPTFPALKDDTASEGRRG